MKNIIYPSLLLICQTQISFCETTDTLSRELREVNIIASRTSINNWETPRNITVLTDTDITAAPYLSLGNLLEEQSGVYLIGTGQVPGSNQSIFIRGSNSNQTSIFIDGIRVTDVSTVNSVPDLSELPLNGIERVEILRGSQSTLYGSPAAGGVITIKTKRSRLPGFHGSIGSNAGVFVKGGSDAGLNGNLSWNSKNGMYVNASGNIFSCNGFNATVDTVTTTRAKGPDADPYLKREFNFTSGYEGNGYDAGLFLRYCNNNTSIDQKAFTDDDNYRINYIRRMAGLHLNNKFSDKFEMKFAGNWTETNRNDINDSSLLNDGKHYDRSYTKEKYFGELLSGELTATYTALHYNLTGGIASVQERMNQDIYIYSAAYDPFIYESHTSLDSINPMFNTKSIFIHGNLEGDLISSYLHDFRLMGGFRYQKNSIFGNNWALDINPSFIIGEHTLLYFSFAEGFTNPSLYQIYATDTYIPWDGQPGTNLSLGNRGLKTEITASSELGLKGSFDEKWDYQFSIFHTNTKNYIDFVYLWEKNIPVTQIGSDPNRDDFRGYRYLNIGQQVAFGTEFYVSRKINDHFKLRVSGCLVNGYINYLQANTSDPSLAGTQVQLYANGSYLNENVSTKGLIRRPSTMEMMLNYIPVKSTGIRFDLRYIGPRYDAYYDNLLGPMGALNRTRMKGYTLAGLSVSHNFKNALRMQLGIENLFNLKYQEILGFATRGIGLHWAFSYNF